MTIKELKDLVSSIPVSYDNEDVYVGGDGDFMSPLLNEVKLSKEVEAVYLFIDGKIIPNL